MMLITIFLRSEVGEMPRWARPESLALFAFEACRSRAVRCRRAWASTSPDRLTPKAVDSAAL